MRTLKYIIGISLAVGLVACDDFLVETPQTAFEKEGIYNTVGSANAVLSGAYSTLAEYDYFGFNYFHVVNVTSGMGVSVKDNDKGLTAMNIEPTNTNMTKMYIGMYKTIRVVNDIIEGMKTSAISSEAEKNRIAGEAYLMRGMTYFNLVRLFGRVSLVIMPPTSYGDAQTPRAEVADVYKQIISDLTDAYSKLPLPADKVVGRPHKYAAQALLAKVYLTLAGNEEESEYWQKAYDAALDVYKHGGYELVTLDKMYGSTNKNNKESIIEIQFSGSVNDGRMTETTFPSGHSLMSNLPAKGKSWGKTRPTQRAFDQFEEGDPRREFSFVHTEYKTRFPREGKPDRVALYPLLKKGKGQDYINKDSEYPAWKKYADPTLVIATNANFVYYRYADLLLVLAEAANEIGEDAMPYLKLVLDRARDSNGDGSVAADEIYPSDPVETDKASLREFIFRERLKELTGECDEWYTVRRRGAGYLKKIMEEHNARIEELYGNKNVPVIYVYDTSNENVTKNLLMPIPADEINRNEDMGQDEQNPGY